MAQSALGFALCKLQAVDVLQTSFVLAHLLVDDQLHTPAGGGIHKNVRNQSEALIYIYIDIDIYTYNRGFQCGKMTD